MDVTEFHSTLDSDRFGYKVAKVNKFEVPVQDLVKTLNFENYKLVISKVDAADIQLVNQLEECGFLIKDIQLTYKFDLSEALRVPLSDDVIVREAVMSDKEELYRIALDSFESYGHYSADEKLNHSQCREIYGDWIRRSFDTKIADKIFVAEVLGEIAGFLSHKIYENPTPHAVGGIGAVNPKYRSRNVFRAITVSGINWALENKCAWVEHNVLITNIPVMRSFIKLGFKPAKSAITFHKWF